MGKGNKDIDGDLVNWRANIKEILFSWKLNCSECFLVKEKFTCFIDFIVKKEIKMYNALS